MQEIVSLAIVRHCSATGWDFGGHGGGDFTFGEISMDHHQAGGISLGQSSLHEGNGWASDIGIGGHGSHFVPVVKHIGYPVLKSFPIHVPHVQVSAVAQPYPFHVLVPKPVAIPVEKQEFTKIEKHVPTPVEKIIPVKIEKPVPFTVVKPVAVPVIKHIPIKIPLYKTVVHKVKGH
ncbi:hypothetical protein KM043_018365 [Ampulex compressa]|nr:hypothetical protein KM043_018365 [Ampulex compressa]